MHVPEAQSVTGKNKILMKQFIHENFVLQTTIAERLS